MTKRLLFLGAALLAAGGCSVPFLQPREDPTRFFVLAPVEAAAPEPAVEPGTLVVVGPLRLPDYLLRPELVLRVGPNQLEPSQIDRWAEPIDRAVLRILCLDLAALLPESSVVPFPTVGAWPAVQVEIEISAFEVDAAGKARLEARWHVRDAAERSSHERALERDVKSTAAAAVVEAMSALLGELAADIARELPSARAAEESGAPAGE